MLRIQGSRWATAALDAALCRSVRRRIPTCPVAYASSFINNEELRNLVDYREKMRRQLPMQSFRSAGVSFENRQALIAGLEPGTAVIFEREPLNPFDPQAVAIRLMNGDQIGYIPKDETSAFVHFLCFGQIRSVGQNEEGLWGVHCSCQPVIPPVISLSIPANLLSLCAAVVPDLEASKRQEWLELKMYQLKKSNGKCTITTAPTNHVEARWSMNTATKEVTLVGFAAQHPLVSSIQYMKVGDSLYDLCRIVALMNGLREDEAATFFTRQVEQSEKKHREGWTLNLEFLNSL